MTLTDAATLVALIDADAADHEVCALALGELQRPLVTTRPALTEAMHLLSRAGGTRGQQALWTLLFSERLRTGRARRRTWRAPNLRPRPWLPDLAAPWATPLRGHP
ncbi:MAG: hypothetical protein ACRDQA_18895 [Nocardioidaceae bacterium]